MRRRFLFLVAVMISAAAYSDSARGVHGKAHYRQATIDWQFDTRRLEYDQPDTRIYLIVDGRRVFLLRASSQFTVLERQDYKSHGVPANAVAASTGWWAGQGQDLYVIRRGRRLVVYVRFLDEQAPVPAYERLKIIPLRR